MSRELRVLHLVNHVRDSGNGIVNATVDLACCQRRLGIQVAVASSGGHFEALLEDCGVRHLNMAAARGVRGTLRAVADLRAILTDFSPDIVHAHMIAPALLAFAARALHRFRLVTTVHNEFQRSAVLMGVGDRVIAISDAVDRALRRRGLPGRRLRLVRNGPLSSPRTVPPALTEPAALDRPAIVTVGGLYRRKGIDILIAAFHSIAGQFPTTQLYIVGDGPDRAEFERAAASGPGAGRIHFLGFRRAPLAYMLAADIFVLASRREPFGLVLAEARQAGVAIVASDVDGIPEVLDGGRAGWLIPPADATILANALGRLLASPAERAIWRARAVSGLDWLSVDRMCRETLAVYEELLAPGATAPQRSTAAGELRVGGMER